MSLETSQSLLENVTAALAPVAGVVAVVLGGSRGRGVHHAGSDYDIGLYTKAISTSLHSGAGGLNDAGPAKLSRRRSGARRDADD